MVKEYVIAQKTEERESFGDFCTRLANEIQTINCKIINMDLDLRGRECKAIIHYEKNQ